MGTNENKSLEEPQYYLDSSVDLIFFSVCGIISAAVPHRFWSHLGKFQEQVWRSAREGAIRAEWPICARDFYGSRQGYTPVWKVSSIDNIRILGIELDLAWSGGSCEEIHLRMKIPPQEPPLHARSSPIPRIRILSFGCELNLSPIDELSSSWTMATQWAGTYRHPDQTDTWEM